jgi:hypothetical protein
MRGFKSEKLNGNAKRYFSDLSRVFTVPVLGSVMYGVRPRRSAEIQTETLPAHAGPHTPG